MPGDTLEVGAPVLEVAGDEAGPDADSQASRADADTTEKDAYRAEERAGSGNVLIGYGTTERAGSGRRRARAVPVAPAPSAVSTAPPTAPDATESTASSRSELAHSTTGRALDESAAPRRPVAVRSPLVRRLARDLGVDVQTITGTGADGAITRGDVLRAAVDSAVDGVALDGGTASGGTASGGGGELDGLAVRSRERMGPLRKAVSAKLSRSRSEIPEATVWVDVDATRLWELRAAMAPEGGKAPSLTALVARFALIALEDYPLLASRLSDDAGEIISFEGVNLGIAADTERGLMVPVVPRAHELTVEQLDAALRELAATARSGSMPPERLRGSTFTLNNYGGFGVDGSAAIINHPDVAILGIGRMIERPWVVDGTIVARRIAQLSLVFDHRVCDGGYAAGFLRRVVGLIEHPLRAYGRI
ncbi:dihydrolipoamide acetyltransferase component of pyruvate dehydrogenase complex [Microbacterium suwonense]|uniref:Dihydrolipoamide acetyltransferase component of pyruvate dehydrogenase complex n=1 Tax=Microbacterium suwonense TaxID=683047 RepID=A0ABM8FTK1_9MICO|nr:dihydrolipoamide acetyltransferase component of pyruvate dehydrogenase complex [Microbacterium suwonense]